MSDTSDAKVDSGRQPGDPAGLPGFPRAGTPRVDSAQPRTGHRFLRRRAWLAHRQRVHTAIGPTRDFMTVNFGCAPGPRSATWRTCVPRYSTSSYRKVPHPTKPRIATDAEHWWPTLGAPRGRRLKRPDLPRLTGLSNIRRNQRFRRLGAGDQFIHLRTPIGMHLEFVTQPHGRHYHCDAAILTWNPVQPADIARRAST